MSNTTFCNKCQAYVHSSEIAFVNDIHYHLEEGDIGGYTTNGHDIAEDYDIPEYDEPLASNWDTTCGATLHGKTALGNDMEHTCYKPSGHYPETKHSCFMAPNACSVGEW